MIIFNRQDKIKFAALLFISGLIIGPIIHFIGPDAFNCAKCFSGRANRGLVGILAVLPIYLIINYFSPIKPRVVKNCTFKEFIKYLAVFLPLAFLSCYAGIWLSQTLTNLIMSVIKK